MKRADVKALTETCIDFGYTDMETPRWIAREIDRAVRKARREQYALDYFHATGMRLVDVKRKKKP